MLDGVTRHIGLILDKGPPFVYLPSWVPTHPRRALGAAARGSSLVFLFVHIPWTHVLAMGCVKVFCEIFRKVFLAWVPLYVKLFVQDLVCDLEKNASPSTVIVVFYSDICNPSCCAVVTMHWCWRFAVAQFSEG